jgi:cytochrome P450 family 130
VQGLARTATRDVEIGGVEIRDRERVVLAWGAANTDEREFVRP